MAFATASDVAAVTGASYEAADLVQLSALLDAASEYLQSVIGCRVAVPAETVTVALTVPSGERRVRLPSAPVREVIAVTVDGAACTQWRVVDGALYRTDGWVGCDDYVSVQVTYRHGYDVAPGDLKSWAIALAVQAHASTKALGTLSPGAVQSVRIDDYSVSYATGGDASSAGGGFTVPAAVAASLRAAYGGGAYLVRA